MAVNLTRGTAGHAQALARLEEYRINTCAGSPSSTVTRNWTGLGNFTINREVLVEGENPVGWRELIGKGIVPYTEYHVRSQKVSNLVAMCDTNACTVGTDYSFYRIKWAGHSTSVATATIPDPPSALEPNLDMLLQEAHAKVRDEGFMLMVELAESKKTAAMALGFKNSVLARAAGIHKEVEKRIRQRRKPSKRYKGRKANVAGAVYSEFLSTWMESRYGWSTVVYSAQDLVDAVKRFDNKNARYVYGSAKQICSASTPLSLQGWTWDSKTVPNQTKVIESVNDMTITGRARVIGLVTSQSPNLFSLGNLGTLLNVNPLTTAYELVPYSWLVDWALNIRDILSAHWPTSFFEATTACVSRKAEHTVRVDYKHYNTAYPTKSIPQVEPSVFEYKSSDYHRVPREDIPLVLTFRDKTSLKKAVDALALLDGAVRRSLTGRGVRV